MTRILTLLFLLQAAVASAGQDDLDRLVGEALAEHPALAAAEARVAAAAARADGAGTLPDPQLSFGWFVESVETRVGPQRAKLGLRQRIPWFGELGLASEMGGLAADAEAQRLAGARLSVVRDLEFAVADLWLLDRESAVVAEQSLLLEQAENVLRASYRGGDARHGELLRLQVERSRLDERATALADDRRPALALLAAALGRRNASDIVLPEVLPETPATDTLDAHARDALMSSPALLALARERDRAERGVALAGKRGLPDFTLGLDYIDTGDARMAGVEGSGKDPLALSLSLNLPIWRGRVRAERAESVARRRAVEATLDDRAFRLEADLEHALNAYRSALRQGELHRDELLPAARESAAVSLEAYRAGRAAFADLIDSHRLLLELELALARSEANRFRHHAAVKAIAGMTSEGDPHE